MEKYNSSLKAIEELLTQGTSEAYGLIRVILDGEKELSKYIKDERPELFWPIFKAFVANSDTPSKKVNEPARVL